MTVAFITLIYFVIRMFFSRTIDKKLEKLDLIDKKLDTLNEIRDILKKHFEPQNSKIERMECQ